MNAINTVTVGADKVCLYAQWSVSGGEQMIFGGDIAQYPESSSNNTGAGLLQVVVNAIGATISDLRTSTNINDGYIQYVYPGAWIKLPSIGDVSRGDDVLLGWTCDGANYKLGETVQINSPMTFTARWYTPATDIDWDYSKILNIGDEYSVNIPTGLTWGRYSASNHSASLNVYDENGTDISESSWLHIELITTSLSGINSYTCRTSVDYDSIASSTGVVIIELSARTWGGTGGGSFYKKWMLQVRPIGTGRSEFMSICNIYLGESLMNTDRVIPQWKSLLKYSTKGYYLEYKAPKGTTLLMPGDEYSDNFESTAGKWCAWSIPYNGTNAYFPIGFHYTLGTFTVDTLTAYYKESTYLVVYDYNGGIVDNYSAYEQQAYVVSGTDLITLNKGIGVTNSSGDTLIGWNWVNCPQPVTGMNSTTEYNSDVLFPCGFTMRLSQPYVVLRAVWHSGNRHVVQFSGDGYNETYSVPSVKLALPIYTYLKAGMYISKWTPTPGNVMSNNLNKDDTHKWIQISAPTTINVSYGDIEYSVRIRYYSEGRIFKTVVWHGVKLTGSENATLDIPNSSTPSSKSFIGWAISESYATNKVVAYKSGESWNWEIVLPTLLYNESIQAYEMSLFAVWADLLAPDEFQIIYLPNDSPTYPCSQYPGIMVNQKYNSNSCEFTVSQSPCIRPGWTFMGWGDSPTSKVISYNPGDNIIVSESNSYEGASRTKALYAIWVRFKHVLTLYTHDSELYTVLPAVYSETNAPNLTVELPSTSPTYGVRQFLGWSTVANNESAEYGRGNRYTFKYAQAVVFEGSSEQIITATGEDKLYGVWKGRYTQLIYSSNGGNSQDYYASSESIATNITFTVWEGYSSDQLPTRIGYTFTGWADNAYDTTAKYHAGDKVSIPYNTSKTLYAVWSYNHIDIGGVATFDSQGVLLDYDIGTDIVDLNNGVELLNTREYTLLTDMTNFNSYQVFTQDKAEIQMPHLSVDSNPYSEQVIVRLFPSSVYGEWVFLIRKRCWAELPSGSLGGVAGAFPANSYYDEIHFYKVMTNLDTTQDYSCTPPTCSFTKVTMSDGVMNRPEVIFIENILSITDRRRPDITDIPIPTKSARDRYVIDLGVTRSISLTFTRVNPPNPDNQSLDSKRWTNAKWIRKFREFFDIWQNSTYNGDEKKSGGMTFKLTSTNSRLYPERVLNVYLDGVIDINYGLSLTRVTMPLKVGSMLLTSANKSYNESVMFASSASATDVKLYQTIRGTTFTFPSFEEITSNDSAISWINSVNSVTFAPHQSVSWSEIEPIVKAGGRFYPKYGVITQSRVYTDSSNPIEITLDARYRYKAILVGGGGSSGGRHNLETTGSGITYIGPTVSGAGAGAYRIDTIITVANTTRAVLVVGKGGEGKPGSNGEDGQPSTITLSSGMVYSAGGGEGGQHNAPYAGGGKAVPGGNGARLSTANTATIDMSSHCTGGSTETDGQSGTSHKWGAGGGASNLNVVVNGTRYQSIGGGASNLDGVYGGGGASVLGGAGRGGDGIIILYTISPEGA